MSEAPAAWQRKVVQELFKRPADDVFRKISVEEMVAVMDANGVERAILTLRLGDIDRETLAFGEAHPNRFAYSVMVDPRTGMRALRQLEGLVGGQPIKLARVIPCLLDAPPSDRIYYPLYAKCIELGLPISINTGIPGPLLPARYQDPMHLDEVCLFFPELVVIMANGADPWWDVAIRLMLKFKNLYLKTSAFAPKYLPPSLLQFMNTRGQHKVMFGTDFPFLTPDRCIAEARALDLREGVLDKYLYENAARVLYREGTP